MANDPIRVGLIGLGFIGKVHAQAYHSIPFCFKEQEARVELRAVLRTKTGRDLDLLKSLGNPFATTDPQAFYGQGLDMVDICTPNVLHLEQAKDALAHNVHLYMEKPLGFNLDHAREITASARSAGSLTHTAFMMRYYPAVRQAKAIITSGVLGEIYNFNVHFYHHSYMDPQRPISWRLQHAIAGGGALADLGIHVIDLARYLLGEFSWVQSHMRTFIEKRPKSPGSSDMVTVDVDDWSLCTVGLENGALGTIEATRMSGAMGDSTRMEIFGSRGGILVDLKDPIHCKYYDQKGNQYHTGDLDFPVPEGERKVSTFWPPAKMSLGPFLNAHTACIYDFLHHIKSGKESPLNFADALRSQEILEAAYISADHNAETISLPLT